MYRKYPAKSVNIMSKNIGINNKIYEQVVFYIERNNYK